MSLLECKSPYSSRWARLSAGRNQSSSSISARAVPKPRLPQTQRIRTAVFIRLLKIFRSRHIRRWQLFVLISARRAIGALALINFRSEMGFILGLLAEPMQIELGQRDLGAHQNDELSPGF